MSGVADTSELKAPAFEVFVGILSILAIVNLVLLAVMDSADLRSVLLIMNAVLSVIFIGDFVYRMKTATSKRHYFLRQMGWADLLASLPLPQFKVLRAFRVVRVVRLSRAYGLGNLVRRMLADRAGSALLTMVLMGLLVLQFGSLWMLALEKGEPDGNLRTASDAIWYVLVTMSTVGYGDQFPVSNAGRVLGAVIIVIGVGIFGTFTGYLANLFLAGDPEVEAAEAAADVARLDELHSLLQQQQTSIDELRRLLTQQRQS
jgi:Ion transport protein